MTLLCHENWQLNQHAYGELYYLTHTCGPPGMKGVRSFGDRLTFTCIHCGESVPEGLQAMYLFMMDEAPR